MTISRDAGRRIAGRFSPIRTTPLELRYIPAGGGFLALTPAKTDAPLQALERACVSEPDSLRAPIGEADIARRGPLPEAQARYPRTWGYHLVFEFFRFHITLSGSFEDRGFCSPVSRNGSPRISPPSRDGPSLSTPWPFCRQPSRRDPFVVVERFPFGND